MIWFGALLLMVQPAPAAPGQDRHIDLTPPQGTSSLSPEARLAERLAALKASTSEDEASALAAEVISLWEQQGGDTAQYMLDRGRMAAQAGEWTLAERQYHYVRQLEPELSEGWIRTAEAAAARADWSFAMEALERALVLEPNRFDAYVMLGSVLERAESPEGALEAYKEALKIFPLHPRAQNGVDRLEAAAAGRAL